MDLDRRRLLAAGAALGAFSTASPAFALSGPPVARVQPAKETLFGVEVVDRYRWMENPKDPDWLPFLKGQNAWAHQVLDAIPGRAALQAKISAVSGDTAVTVAVQQAGPRLFFEQRPVGADNYKLFVREADGKVRTLIDPTTMGSNGQHMSLDWWRASDDGARLAYGLSPAGSEASVLHVMEVGSGQVLPERIDKTDSAQPSWLPDGSGFFYTRFVGELRTPEYYLDGVARFHRIGTDPATDPAVLKRGLVAGIPMESNQTPFVTVQPGGRRVIAAVTDIRTEAAFYVADTEAVLAGKPVWARVCDFPDAVTAYAVVGPDLFLLANRDAPRGRVLKTALAAPDLATASEVIAQGPMVAENLNASKSAVFVTLMDGGVERVKTISAKGVADLPLPYEGSVRAVYTAPETDEAWFDLTGWLQPRSMWRFDPAAGKLADGGLAPLPKLDLSPYESFRTFATARDGVKVPVSVIARKGFPRDGSNPCLVDGYGAYQISNSPSFAASRLPFLDAGGIYAVAHVRGGGEYGREWHFAGQKATKYNTWRDMIDCCEHLIAEKITSTPHLAITGTSAGGITVGRSITERPDLFAAAISNVGWSDPLRYVAEQDSFGEIPEWGAIDDEAGFKGLLAMDSYQAVKDGVAYPAVLCVTGAQDPRVAPFHVAKMAARLQAATSSGKPVLLRVDFDAGHGIGSTRAQADALAADMFAFVLWRTGGKGFG
ncbi:MAG TPA: prolyl oligopeptidase family serine peptidase [Caulobacteraceae bacterium]|nr:prolyl oligopeptidase family serine peptidase [Caulobacteraceae bacterium]